MILEAVERHDGVVARHPLDRRQKREQPALGDLRGDLGAHARSDGGLVDDDAAPGLLDRGEDGVGVERLDRGDVDDLGRHAPCGEGVGGGERLLGHRAPGDERDIAPFAQREADVERQRLAGVVDLLLERTVDALGLEEHHRIGIAHGGQQQAVGAPRGRRNDDA